MGTKQPQKKSKFDLKKKGIIINLEKYRRKNTDPDMAWTMDLLDSLFRETRKGVRHE